MCYDSSMPSKPFFERSNAEKSTLEKLGGEIESLTTDKEVQQMVRRLPAKIKRGKQRAALALAASNTVFQRAVDELQGLGILHYDSPTYEFLIRKILPTHFSK